MTTTTFLIILGGLCWTFLFLIYSDILLKNFNRKKFDKEQLRRYFSYEISALDQGDGQYRIAIPQVMELMKNINNVTHGKLYSWIKNEYIPSSKITHGTGAQVGTMQQDQFKSHTHDRR